MTDTQVLATAQQLGSRALSWLHTCYRNGWGRLPDDTIIDLAQPNDVYKPLCEAATAASLVLRDGVAGPQDARAARDILDDAWEQLREGDMLYERQLRHITVTDPLETYAPPSPGSATGTPHWRNCSNRSACSGPCTPSNTRPADSSR